MLVTVTEVYGPRTTGKHSLAILHIFSPVCACLRMFGVDAHSVHIKQRASALVAKEQHMRAVSKHRLATRDYAV
eukprot:5034572-Pleurochrysis_carterae.AAC.1